MSASNRVVVYASLGLRRGISDLLWAFRKSNKMEEFPAYLDDHPFQLIERIVNERKYGMRTADIVIMPHYAVTKMAHEDLLRGYEPEGLEESPPNMRGRDSGAVPVGVTFMAMAYNTKLVPPSRLPSELLDLGDSPWVGRLGAQSLTASRAGNLGAWYLAFLKKECGERNWRRFLESLARGNRPKVYDCIDHLLQGLLAGEVTLALTVYSLAYFREKSSGSPIALVDSMLIPHMMTFTSAAITRSADESGPARKFMDFLLSSEAQKIIGSIPGIAPVRKGTSPSYDFEHNYGPKTAFHPVESDFTGAADSVKLFHKLGLP